ncbi:MAG: FAD-dependent oxidoreductase [Gammaproteobacteria bacterium]|nr:FAD-dependent oxidoreductase [Gammaproteobacteria bacterium]
MSGKRPRRFDADVVVIGAGSAGLVAALIAAALEAEVVLVESDVMGGECLNTGCVPSKALIAAARRAHLARTGSRLGVEAGSVNVDFGRVMAHVRGAIDAIAPNDSAERYRGLGVRCVSAHARLVDPWTVDAGGRHYRTRSIVIATGADPAVPPVPGLGDTPYLTSHTLWHLTELPRRLAILGGGPIGCELARAFARLGSKVEVFEMQQRLLAGEDPEVGDLLLGRLGAEGVTVRPGTRVERVTPGSPAWSGQGGRGETGFDHLLVAAGRRPRVHGFGLEELGVEIVDGAVGVNPFMQTNYPHIYACGDVAGPWQFTHAAAHRAWHAAVNALLRPFWRMRVGYEHLPWCIYTDPEIARVGLNETAAAAAGVRFDSTAFPIAELDRALVEAEPEGFVKILTRPGSGRVLGATVVCAHAGELITTMTLAMKHGITLDGLLATIVPYPTWSEAIKRTAGARKRERTPAWLLPWLARFHRLRR